MVKSLRRDQRDADDYWYSIRIYISFERLHWIYIHIFNTWTNRIFKWSDLKAKWLHRFVSIVYNYESVSLANSPPLRTPWTFSVPNLRTLSVRRFGNGPWGKIHRPQCYMTMWPFHANKRSTDDRSEPLLFDRLRFKPTSGSPDCKRSSAINISNIRGHAKTLGWE